MLCFKSIFSQKQLYLTLMSRRYSRAQSLTAMQWVIMQSCEHKLSTLGYWRKKTDVFWWSRKRLCGYGTVHYHTTVVALRIVARSSEEVGGVGACNGSQQMYDLVSKPETWTSTANDSFIWDCTSSSVVVQCFSGRLLSAVSVKVELVKIRKQVATYWYFLWRN